MGNETALMDFQKGYCLEETILIKRSFVENGDLRNLERKAKSTQPERGTSVSCVRSLATCYGFIYCLTISCIDI
jgi:hypothetical protein